MIGSDGGRVLDSQSGCLPQAANMLFRRIARLEEDAVLAGRPVAHLLRASFIEIYRGNVRDLLSTTHDPVNSGGGGGGGGGQSTDIGRSLRLREAPGDGTRPGHVYAEGAREVFRHWNFNFSVHHMSRK